MVAIEEVVDDDGDAAAAAATSRSEERLSDAAEIEALLDQLTRPTARMQVESLVRKIRKEAAALARVDSAAAAATAAPPVVVPPPATAPKPVAAAAAGVPSAAVSYKSIDRFAFDAGGSSDKFVTLYLPIPGVGALKKTPGAVSSTFGKDSFDVTVVGLETTDSGGGVTKTNYRLKRDNLEHEIVPEDSKHVVKKDKIIVKLSKKKGEYGSYDYWTKLTDPKKADKKKSGGGGGKKRDDPSAGLMDMMKDLYDSGDDNMRKMIGETMLKQRNGELNNDPAGGGGGLGGMGGMGKF